LVRPGLRALPTPPQTLSQIMGPDVLTLPLQPLFPREQVPSSAGVARRRPIFGNLPRQPIAHSLRACNPWPDPCLYNCAAAFPCGSFFGFSRHIKPFPACSTPPSPFGRALARTEVRLNVSSCHNLPFPFSCRPRTVRVRVRHRATSPVHTDVTFPLRVRAAFSTQPDHELQKSVPARLTS